MTIRKEYYFFKNPKGNVTSDVRMIAVAQVRCTENLNARGCLSHPIAMGIHEKARGVLFLNEMGLKSLMQILRQQGNSKLCHGRSL